MNMQLLFLYILSFVYFRVINRDLETQQIQSDRDRMTEMKFSWWSAYPYVSWCLSIFSKIGFIMLDSRIHVGVLRIVFSEFTGSGLNLKNQ